MPPVCRHGNRLGSKVEIPPKGFRRYALDVGCLNLYSGRLPEHFKGENQSSDVLLPKQYAFHPCNRAILDSDPVARLQKGMRLNSQSAFNNSPYPFNL